MNDTLTRSLEVLAGHLDQVEKANQSVVKSLETVLASIRQQESSSAVTRDALLALVSTIGDDEPEDDLRQIDLTATEINMLNAVDPIFDVIKHHESRGNYNAVFAHTRGYPGVDVTAMTLPEVRAWQDWYVRVKGSRSSAVGAFQIIRKTFDGLLAQIPFPPGAKYSKPVQDRMGFQLLLGRGLAKYLVGTLSESRFADGLAYEWASLPLANGKSAYDGDGLNSASATRGEVLRAIRAAKEGYQS